MMLDIHSFLYLYAFIFRKRHRSAIEVVVRNLSHLLYAFFGPCMEQYRISSPNHSTAPISDWRQILTFFHEGFRTLSTLFGLDGELLCIRMIIQYPQCASERSLKKDISQSKIAIFDFMCLIQNWPREPLIFLQWIKSMQHVKISYFLWLSTAFLKVSFLLRRGEWFKIPVKLTTYSPM